MASSSETVILKLLESQVNHQQQLLGILTSVNNQLSALNRNVAGNAGVIERDSSVIIHNNQIQTINFNNGCRIEGTIDEVGNNPSSEHGQQDEGNRSSQYICEEHRELYEAAKDGNWVWAEQIFRDQPGMMTVEITNDSETALHIAADHTKWEFVENLVQLLPPEKLALKDSKHGYTALHTAAMEGNTRVAKLMVKRNGALTQIRDNDGRVPLHTAARFVSDGQTEALEYLYSATNKEVFSGPHGASLLCDLIDSNFYEIEFSLLQRFPKLVTEKTGDPAVCALEVLPRRPFSFRSGNKTAWWQSCIYPFLQVETMATNEPGRSTTCQMGTTVPTDIRRSTGSQTDAATSSDLGNSTVQLDGMETSRCQVGLASPGDLASNPVLQVCTMPPNGVSSSTVVQVNTTAPNDLGGDTILEVDTVAPSNLARNTVLQTDSMVRSNDLSSTAVLQVDTMTPSNLDSSSVPQVDTTTPSDLDRAGTENRLAGSSVDSSTMSRETMKVILVHPFTWLSQVPLIKKLCEQKLINVQASKLVSIMLELIDSTMNKAEVLDFFKKSSLMKTAIMYGTTEVVEQCLNKFPFLIWSEMEGQTMVQIAIGERNEKVFNFICEKSEEDMDELNHRSDDRGNSILHYAANIAPSAQLNSVSGAALQMQREMQWFKVINDNNISLEKKNYNIIFIK